MHWITQNRNHEWATCSITQVGFVRILSSRSFDPNAPSPGSALELLKVSTGTNRLHRFWAEGMPMTAMSPTLRDRIKGHKQAVDAYLLALAMHHNGTFVTFDGRMRSLAPEGSEEFRALVILQA
jgi:hypothetical protein